MEGHQHSLSASSSSSAVDLSGTPAGLGSSAPPSPALHPSDSFSRRRTSWGRVDAGQDPLRLDINSSEPEADSHNAPRPGMSGWVVNEDPFFSPAEDDALFSHHYPYGGNEPRPGQGTYTTSQTGPSSASLISTAYRKENYREDDEAALTRNMSRPGTSSSWSQSDSADPEFSGATLRKRRRTLRYSTSPSPLKKTGSTLRAVSQRIRRVSLRVVNLAGMGVDDHVRLLELDERDTGHLPTEDDVDGDLQEEEEEEEGLPDLALSLPIRGRTLACLGPTNKFRLAMYHFLVYTWTEPAILLLIVFNAIVLTIQAARNIALSSSDGNPPQIKGYFWTWEDYALFALFVIFTLESLARIAVSGFLLDPDVPVSTLFTSLFSDQPPPGIPASSSNDPSHSFSRQGQLFSQNLTFIQRLEHFRYNLMRPFVLHHSIPPLHENMRGSSTDKSATRPRSDTTQSRTPIMEKLQQAHSHIRNPSHPTFLSTALKSDNPDMLSLPFRVSIQKARGITQRNVPYLRHSWTRIDFVAVVSFWISFGLAMAGVERGTYHIGVFRAISVLRTARLLAITSGTTTIMRSLKTARPLLTSVAYFVLFAMILLSIIGIQSFRGSFRRNCVLQPTGGEDEIPLSKQSCGSYIDPVTLDVMGYVTQSGAHGSPKGFICPLGQICKEVAQNPNNDIESFDTIYFSALQVFIVSTANGWSPLMYSMMDSEFFVSSLFFVVCIIVLNFWLINLFVAVITNTFSAIRSDTQKSAFGAAPLAPVVEDSEDGSGRANGRRVSKANVIRGVYENIRWCWVALALASLVLQATRTVDIGQLHAEILNIGELVLTIVFDVEIFIRVLAHLPDWRSFFNSGQNWLDLVLAVVSSVIQIPVVHNSEVYPWLSIFQLARFYRVILEIPRMKPLLLAVFGNMYGLANMSLFLILINFITALVAAQLLRGDVAQGSFIDFGDIFNSFLAIYQVFSSENWTNVLYGAAVPEIPLRQSAIVIILISGWMFFANFIVLQMFIAVINENFDVAEESKRSRQARHYWATHRPEQARAPWVRRLNPYRWFQARPKAIAVEQLPSNLVLPMQKTLVQDYTLPQKDGPFPKEIAAKRRGPRHVPSRSLNILQNLFTGERQITDVPLTTIRHNRRDSAVPQDPIDEEMERHLEVLAALNSETNATEDISDALHERRAQKADFIRDHPTYDKTFWIFSQKNPLRRMCQKLVAPANGERIFGTPPSRIAHPVFQLLLLLTVIGGIVVECIATPMYRRNYYAQFGLIRASWFDIAETAFGLTLSVEFLIKIIADGFLFTPNAYIRSIWNIFDFFILIGLIINVSTQLVFIGGLSRLTRSLKALRALRLITLVDKMRSTFESLIISGAIRIMDAALLAILYMIPYAVWGLNLFAGKTTQCNNSSATGISDCINEFSTNSVPNAFGYLVPSVWNDAQPSTTFSFDSFRSSLLILFEIVSLEGWIDVMGVVVSIVGEGQQPQTNVSQFNAIFFLIYNLLGGVVILTLFVSIIIGNFTSKTGTALLTQPQREWIDLQKLIKRQRPSKRPKRRPTWTFRAWCYDRAVHKRGWWHTMMTGLFVLHIVALMTQTFTDNPMWDDIRDDFFVAVTVIYLVDIFVRLFGLGWASYSANGWNLFDIIVAGGSLITTLIVTVHAGGFVIQQLQKLFITSIAFKLVQRTNSLNKLFKTAVASLPVIMSLLGLWVILFLFFSILFVEVFGMTKWGTAETRNQNYSTVSSAILMLAFMTTGEGWNQYMHDFAVVYPRCTNASALSDSDSDCGSVGWAFTLFIAWNLLSMYIFANLFTGVVVESFSYVFQMTGGAKSITREEMRSFKKVWAEFANPRTGYLERSNFVPFFGRLSGIFEVRIYPAEYSIPKILARSKATDGGEAAAWLSRTVEGINLDTLEANVNIIDRASIKRRKSLYNRLYHEARISYEPGKGISFTNMLLLLAHHKFIDDRQALILKDLVVRTETNKLVSDLVDFDRVQSLLLMISHRRRFLALREQKRMEKMMQHDIPAIIVDDFPVTPPSSTRDITSPGQDILRRFMDPESPMSHAGGHSPEMLTWDSPSRSSLQRSRRTSDVSMLSIDMGLKLSFDSSPSRDSHDYDPQTVLSSMQNSMWGDMMIEAAEDEE